MFNIPWSLMKTEIGLVGLTVISLLLDIFFKKDEKWNKTLANIAIGGVGTILAVLLCDWGNFGKALNGSFIQDGLSYFFKIIFLLAGLFTLFMARDFQHKLTRGKTEFTLLILFSLTGMVFLISANDFLLFFVALETLTVAVYVMTAYLRDSQSSIEAGVKYLILGTLSTALFVYGLSFIYGAAGSVSYDEVLSKISALPKIPLTFLLGMTLVICSLGFKIASVPFQMWVPDIYEGAPTPVTAYLAIGSKAAGFAALVRLFGGVFLPAYGQWVPALAVLSALTILYGNLAAIPQTNIKRLLGYSSIGHAGYLMIGLVCFFNSGREAILYYLLSYLFSTGGVFLVLVACAQYTKTDEISELKGLSKKSPLLACGLLLSLLSLAGVPPLAGFFAKFYILWASVKSGFLWLAVIGLLNVVVSLYYYLKIVKVIYVDKPAEEAPLAVSLEQKAFQYVSIAGIVILGIYQEPLVKFAALVFK